MRELPSLHRSTAWINAKIESYLKELLVFCFLLGLILTVFVPPFQKPDESTHFYKAISVAQGHLVCEKNYQGVFINTIPQYLKTFPEEMYLKFIAFHEQSAFPKSLYLKTLQRETFPIADTNEPSSCVLPFVLYLHTGLALAAPVLFHANPLVIFYLGRLVNFFTAFGIILLAVKLTPRKLRAIPMLTLMLPMTLHQLGSYSKDSLHIATGVFVVACLLTFFGHQQKRNPVVVVLFLLSLVVTILARPYFFCLALLVFLVPTAKDSSTKKYLHLLVKFGFVILVFLLIQFSLSKQIYSADASSLKSETVNQFVYPSVQLRYMSEHPFDFFVAIKNTVEYKFGFLISSMIGEFGWLDYQLQWYVYVLYAAITFFIFFVERENIPKIRLFDLFILVSTCLGCVIGVSLAFYLYGSAVAAKEINGLQGRYFITLTPLVMLIIAELWNRYEMNFVRALFIGTFCSIAWLIAVRYYDASDYYYHENVLFPDRNHTRIEKIASPSLQTLQIDPNRKFTGVSIFIETNTLPTNVPYSIELYGPNCQFKYQERVIDASQMKYKQFNDVVFTKLPSERLTELCVSIKPYVITPSLDSSLAVLQHASTKQLMIVPLYLY